MLKNDENFEWKTHRNASKNWISSKQNDGATYGIYLNYFYRKVLLETMLQKAENFQEKLIKIHLLTV